MKYLSPCRQGGSRGLIAGAAVASGQFYSCRAEELNTEHPLQHSPSQTHSQQTLSSSSGLEGWDPENNNVPFLDLDHPLLVRQ